MALLSLRAAPPVVWLLMAREGGTRKALVFPPGAGDLARLSMQDMALEEPALGEVRVRVHAIGLNFADIFTGLALYGPIQSGEVGGEEGGFVPGLEFSGVVESIGSAQYHPKGNRAHGGQLCELSEDVWKLARQAAGEFRVGDRVMGAMRFGSYATHVNVPAHQVRKVPESWSFQEASAFLVQTLTVFYALRALGNVRRGQTALIHSAAGGCGLQALALCNELGVKVVATVGSAMKVKVLRERFPSLLPEQIVVRTTPSEFEGQLRSALKAIGSEGFHVNLDAVLGGYFRPGWNCMAPGGRHIVYGAADMTPQRDSLGVLGWIRLAWQWLRRPFVDPLNLPGENKSVMGFNLIHCFSDAKELGELIDEVMRFGLPPPRVGHVFPFEQALEALRLFRSGQTTGKVVLAVET